MPLEPPGAADLRAREQAAKQGPHRGWFTLSLLLLLFAVGSLVMTALDFLRGFGPLEGQGPVVTSLAFAASYGAMWMANRHRRQAGSADENR